MACLWPNLGLIYSMLRGCLAWFCGLFWGPFLRQFKGLFRVDFMVSLRGCLGAILEAVWGHFVGCFVGIFYVTFGLEG